MWLTMKEQIRKIIFSLDLRALFIFLVVGALTALVYFASFAFLWNLNHINYKVAVSISYVLAVVFQFTANFKFTFKSDNRYLFKKIMRYLVMILINYFITLGVVHAVVENLLLSPYIGIVFSVGITVAVSYLLAKFWIFA